MDRHDEQPVREEHHEVRIRRKLTLNDFAIECAEANRDSNPHVLNGIIIHPGDDFRKLYEGRPLRMLDVDYLNKLRFRYREKFYSRHLFPFARAYVWPDGYHAIDGFCFHRAEWEEKLSHVVTTKKQR